MNHSEVVLSLNTTSMEALKEYVNMTAEYAEQTIEKYLNANTLRNNLTDGRFTKNQMLLIDRFRRNRNIDDPWYYILIAMYSILIICGTLGNVLVVIAVLRKPLMRTARNLFILNLAISDLLLCLITMPLTLIEILSKYWPFNSCIVLCKLIAMLQALSVFVSTISITAIAVDRYQVIVYPTSYSLQFVGAIGILVGIWLLALLLASPLFIYKELIHVDMPPLLQALGIRDVSFCIEDWPLYHGRFYYSVFALCVQYLVPIVVVWGAYYGIYNKLRNRITVVTVNTSQRNAERGRRMKRTNCMLISIAVIFGVSWLPLNFFNLYADFRHAALTQGLLVSFAFCHMIGMSSACSNPLLYGWLNENFRKEFNELFCRVKDPTNVALNGHTASGGQARRRQNNADMGNGGLKLLADCSGGGPNSSVTNGLHGIVTESVALTENTM